MTFEARRDALEPGRIAGPVCVARGDEIGVRRLRLRRKSDAGGKGKRECGAMARGGRAERRHGHQFPRTAFSASASSPTSLFILAFAGRARGRW
jgi:hypothetical protein